jgi:hypothetical protein
VDKQKQVEVFYIAFYGVMLLIGAALAWGLANANPRGYRRLMLPLGLCTALMIYGGVVIAGHYYVHVS